MLDEKQIQQQYEQLKHFIESYISNPRKDKIYKMIGEYEEWLLLSPSSTSKYYFGAYPGGLLLYINTTIKIALETHKMWKDSSFEPDYTTEELIFTAIFHNFGKIGDETQPYYIQETSDWYKKTYGRVYKINPKISYMKVSDRSLFLLNREGIMYTQNEFYGIKLSHGFYDKANESYFINYSKDFTLNTHLHIVLNQASIASVNIISQSDNSENKKKENLKQTDQSTKWGRPSKQEKASEKSLNEFADTFGSKGSDTNTNSKSKLSKDFFDELFPDSDAKENKDENEE